MRDFRLLQVSLKDSGTRSVSESSLGRRGFVSDIEGKALESIYTLLG